MIGKALRFLKPALAVYLSREFFVLLDELRRILRAPKLVNTVASAPIPTPLASARRPHNGSILRYHQQWYVALRSANVTRSRFFHRLTVEGGPSRVHSDTWLLTLDEQMRVVGSARVRDDAAHTPEGIARNGLSDGRLFAWRGQMWGIWSAERVLGDDWENTTNTMAIGMIRDGAIEQFQPLPSPHGLQREKNWMPWVHGDTLRLVYMPANLEVYAVEPPGLRRIHTLAAPDPRLRGYSGSSQVMPWGAYWLCVVHYAARTVRKGSAQVLPSFYLHRFLLLTEQCTIKAVSREFFFEHKGTEFCAGLAIEDDAVLVSYGVDDAASRILRLSRYAVDSLFA